MEPNLYECVTKIDWKVDSIIENQKLAEKKIDKHEEKEWDLFIKMDKRITENEIDLKKLKEFTNYHGIEHKFIYTLFVTLFVLTITLWILK